VDGRQSREDRNGDSEHCCSSNSGISRGTAILVSAGVSETKVYSANYGLPTIDKFYAFCYEASSLGLSQTE
jgi:hypothetical protein